MQTAAAEKAVVMQPGRASEAAKLTMKGRFI